MEQQQINTIVRVNGFLHIKATVAKTIVFLTPGHILVDDIVALVNAQLTPPAQIKRRQVIRAIADIISENERRQNCS